MNPLYDVVVVGGGNAALCAAMEARRAGASVLILEAAPRHSRGGNSRHTRNVRLVHERATDHLEGAYPEDEFWRDLIEVTGETDERLARLLIRDSAGLGAWMTANGVRWQPALAGTLQLSRTNAFFLGGGKALLNTYYDTALRLGVEVAYESEVADVVPAGEGGASVSFRRGGVSREARGRAVVVASGGFEADLDWLGEHWGAAAANFAVRGTPFNKGGPLRALLAQGAKPVADPRAFHAIAVDARGPRFDGGIVTRLDTIPFGIVVNRHAQRFADEGAGLWPKRYASWGALIAAQPDQVAYSILDAKAAEAYMPSAYPPLRAASLRDLAPALGLDPAALQATVQRYNTAIQPGTYDPARLDDCRTAGLDPPKSHWALPLTDPPFLAYPLRPGITFTYHGLAVDERARVLGQDGSPMPGLFAAGEVMAGNVLRRGYLGGVGMTIGSVFGRIAGREAAQHGLA